MKPVTESFDNVQKIEISEKPKTLIECKSRLWDIWRTMTTLYEIGRAHV